MDHFLCIVVLFSPFRVSYAIFFFYLFWLKILIEEVLLNLHFHVKEEFYAIFLFFPHSVECLDGCLAVEAQLNV